MLLQCILDQSGACTFDAAGWKDSDMQQFIPGDDFRQRDSDMTNRCTADKQQATCTNAGHVSNSANNHQQYTKEENCNLMHRKGSDWKMFGVSIRRDTQVRSISFAFVYCYGYLTHYLCSYMLLACKLDQSGACTFDAAG